MPFISDAWGWYKQNREALTPLGALVGGGLVAWAALQQAATARRRHQEQTAADQQRRITESFSKAVEQLASEKIEVRLGGIYTLERISRESMADYWNIMETLSAFVREQTRPREPGAFRLGGDDQHAGDASDRDRPPTDVTAVLAVIVRPPDVERTRERSEGWRFDLRRADLRGAALDDAHLEGADFREAHLEGARLVRAHLDGAKLAGVHLEEANLTEAHLDGADLTGAHLERAKFGGAHLERAHLWGANLAGANLVEAHLEGASLVDARLEQARLGDAHLEGANLTGATAISKEQIGSAFGSATTRLPAGILHPATWDPREPRRMIAG